MPIATFFTLGKTTMESALSRILVGRPLSPERMACMAVAEFASRSSSFFWAKRGDASARHNARVTNLLFKVLSFRDEKLNHEPKLGNGFLGRLSGRLLRRDALYTDLSESCDLNRACSSWRVGYRPSNKRRGWCRLSRSNFHEWARLRQKDACELEATCDWNTHVRDAGSCERDVCSESRPAIQDFLSRLGARRTNNWPSVRDPLED